MILKILPQENTFTTSLYIFWLTNFIYAFTAVFKTADIFFLEDDYDDDDFNK